MSTFLKNKNKLYKIGIFSLFLFSQSFLAVEKTGSPENNQIIEKKEDKLVEETKSIALFFQQTIQFLQKNQIAFENIEEIYTAFMTNHANFKSAFQKLLTVEKNQTNSLTPTEFKLVFEFLNQLLTKINQEKKLNLQIAEINFEELKDTILLIQAFNTFQEKLPEITALKIDINALSETSTESLFDESIFDVLNDLMSRTMTLLKKIADNIIQKNYNKSLFKKFFTKYLKETKEESFFIQQYRELLLEFINECLKAIQDNIFLLSTLRTDFSDLTAKKQQESIAEIIEKSIFVISCIEYQIAHKFLPDQTDIKKFLALNKKLKNSQGKNEEKLKKLIQEKESLFAAIQQKLISGTQKKAADIHTLLSKNTNTSINEKINILIDKIQILTNQERNLCFYWFQNSYRKGFLSTQEFFNKNALTRGLKYFLQHPAILFSAYFGWDMYKFLDPASSPESSYLSMLFTRIVEIYKDLNNINPTHEMTPFIAKKNFLDQAEIFLYGGNIELRNKALSLKNAIASISSQLQDKNLSPEKVNQLEQEKMTYINEHDALLKKINTTTEQGVTNYSPYNAEIIHIKEEITKDDAHFKIELESGKFKDYDQKAKNAFRNNITKAELQNKLLLEKRYTAEYMKEKNIVDLKDLSEEAKTIISKQVDQSLEIAHSWENMQRKHEKLVHPFINPYPFRNIGRNIKQIGPLALPITAGIFAGVVNSYLQKGEGFFTAPKKLLQNIHFLCMGEKFQNEEKIKVIQEDDFKYDLYDKTFDVWRAQGLLDWFDAVIKEVKKVYSEAHATISPELDRAILVIGESGSGKTTLVNAWLKSLTKEANLSGKVEVEFYQIDPKMFTKEIQVEGGRYEKMDIFAEAKAYLKSIKFNNKIVVIHIDEAHLLLGTNEGTFSLTRWADLLSFVTSVNDEQRKNKSRGAMFIIASTNRPDVLPPEILKNPNRFSNIIEIPIPSYTDRISILKGYLTNLGMQTSHIDFDYISGLFEGTNQSYGNVLRIVQKAVVFARVHNTFVTTETLYKFVNELIRSINFTINKLDPYFLDQISSYYSAITTAAVHFEKYQNLYAFDMVTVYPLKNEIESKNVSQLYVYPKTKPVQFGEIFYCKRSYQIDEFSKKTLVLNLIAHLMGTAYCEAIDCGYPRQAQKKLATAYEMIYEFFASSLPEYAHIALQLDLSKKRQSEHAGESNHLLDLGLTKKTTDILKKIESEIKKFTAKDSVKKTIEKIKVLLTEKKIVTRKDLFDNQEIASLIQETEKDFSLLYISIKNLLA